MEDEETDVAGRPLECICSYGESLKIDVSLLVQHSGYFSGLMRSPLREPRQKQVNLGLFTADTIALMMEILCYTTKKEVLNDCTVTYKDDLRLWEVKELLRLIDYLDIPCLFPVCSELLNSFVQNCFGSDELKEIWEIKETYNLVTLENKLLFFLVKNMKNFQVSNSFFFQKLPVELFSKLMLQENLDINSETEVMSMIETWINYSKDERLVHTDDLLRCVHIPSLYKSDCSEIEKITDRLNCKRMDMNKLFSEYSHNPHSLFREFPRMRQVRCGKNVILAFGGIYEDSFSMYQLNTSDTHLRANQNICFPMFYSEISDKLKMYASLENMVRRGSDFERKRQRKYNISYDKIDIRMSQLSNTTSQGQLVEFGSCVYEGFVYILGGQTQMNDEGEFSVKTVHRLDPNSGKWLEVKSMSNSRSLFCVCCVWDMIYAIGGASQSGILQSTEYYLPIEDTWVTGPELPTPLHEHAGCVLNNMIYISGGHTGSQHSDKVWFLGTDDAAWKPAAPLLRSRSYHAMIAVNGKLYVVGGCSLEQNGIEDIYAVEVYDPKTDIWTNIMQMNVPVCDCRPLLLEHTILFIGGYSFNENAYLQQVVAVDTCQNRWNVSKLTFPRKNKKVVGYSCVSMKISGRLLNTK